MTSKATDNRLATSPEARLGEAEGMAAAALFVLTAILARVAPIGTDYG
jgi:hypothetical protein